MKLTTLHNNKFTGEYWDYTSEQDMSGQLTNTYFKVKDLTFTIVTPEKGRMWLYSPEQLRYNTQIRKLRDPAGKPIFVEPISGEEQLSYVGISDPVFDVHGHIIGYRHDLSQGV